MSVVYTLPPKSARLINSSESIKCLLVAGAEPYYNVDAKFEITQTNAGMVYLFDRVSFGCSMGQPVWIKGLYGTGFSAFEIPVLKMVDSSDHCQNGKGLSLVTEMSERPLELWYSSDTTGKMFAEIKGKVFQTVETLGELFITLGVSVTAYEIPATEISGAFRAGISPASLEIFRGGR